MESTFPSTSLNICMVASEVVPWLKPVASRMSSAHWPSSLPRWGNDVAVVLPAYRQVDMRV